ncbi:MAG: c-type cytochrome biogenesis protein CcmI [Candidatus Devosia phytovorans]|uniref:C-type cytochrome biogenesis protein CcmI n=1 Tax=Candidatus Devosia phytovorans TaxID=3121372 RepID=A0AAJ5VRA3_9HYPH|nr:c-type cytochrome biogenesis protein CcmI [Devosia sp.]WEK02761.1 MAG: c-type cytochrome biogenesis protein CcmI [Devosia sp.]
MLFWFIASAITAIACAALFHAARRGTDNATAPELDDANSHFRLVLAGIDADLAAGKLAGAEAQAARGELAREILRAKAEANKTQPSGTMGNGMLLAGIGGIAALTLSVYMVLGSPDLPAVPLAGREEVVAQSIDLDVAIERIESQLTQNPDDLRGWTVIAPAYMQLGRFADAANAYRRVIELGGPTADLQTRLAETLLMAADGQGSDEAMDLLRAAAAAEPAHVLSRLYIAAELTRMEDYPAAKMAWEEALALSTDGSEPWVASAQQGLAVAENGGVVEAGDAQADAVAGMVSGLAARLEADGGTIEEWTRLVRSYIVLNDLTAAQTAYDNAVAAYPQAFDRGDLDTLALAAGLTLNGGTP